MSYISVFNVRLLGESKIIRSVIDVLPVVHTAYCMSSATIAIVTVLICFMSCKI